MTQRAYFDASGMCTCVGDLAMDVPEGGCSRDVPTGTNSRDIWFDGKAVVAATASTLKLPDTLTQEAGTYTADLPAGVIAIVDGARQTGKLVLDRKDERDFHIVIRGKMAGENVVRVQSYVTQRREAYPAIGDQLDALWKAYETLSKATPSAAVSAEATVMLGQIATVKASIPKVALK